MAFHERSHHVLRYAYYMHILSTPKAPAIVVSGTQEDY